VYLVLRNFLHIINAYADSRKTRHIEWDELTEAYPSLENTVEPKDGNTSVTMSVHCECTLAIRLLLEYANRRTPPKFAEIGISKYSCWLCQKYLDFLFSASEMRFIVTGYQGKMQAGWIPPHGPANARNDIIRLIQHEMDEILESVERKRRSDSHPREPGLEDVMKTNPGRREMVGSICFKFK
jgi:hypothetical protein